MSETPKCDAEGTELVVIEFARKLEIELATVTAERDRFKAWHDAVQDALVCDWRLSDETANDPRKALQALILCNETAALDPSVSERAQKLRDTYLADRDRLKLYIERFTTCSHAPDYDCPRCKAIARVGAA